MIAGRPSITFVVATVVFVFVVITFMSSGSVRSQLRTTSKPTKLKASAEKHSKSDVFNATLGVGTIAT